MTFWVICKIYKCSYLFIQLVFFFFFFFFFFNNIKLLNLKNSFFVFFLCWISHLHENVLRLAGFPASLGLTLNHSFGGGQEFKSHWHDTFVFHEYIMKYI